MRLPIPLGGTSNHFSSASLRYLRGWDPHNVTEDADLGLRAAGHGLRVGITNSTTWEEAWLPVAAVDPAADAMDQGVHGDRAGALTTTAPLLARKRVRGVVGLVVLIMGAPAMFLAAPVLWALWMFSFLGGSMGWLALPTWARQATFANLVVGNVAMIVLSALAARRRKAYDLIPFALLNPFYWILHSIAAWRALYQLIRAPGHWEKTPHGLLHGPRVTP